MATKKATNNDVEVQKNIIVLRNNRRIEIKETKLKYFSSGDFSLYQFFEKHGLENIIIAPDGRILALRFLSSVLDKPYEMEQVNVAPEGEDAQYETRFTFDSDLEQLYDEELSLSEFKKIMEVAKEVNGISEKN